MISSNLKSQLFSKIATWDILTANNLVWGARSPMRIAQLKIEVWSTVVYVHLPANPTSRVSPQGISRFLSMWDYLDWMMARTLSKANNIQARLIGTNKWEVEGSQRAHYIVDFTPFGGRCRCMLFVCLANRIKSECPYFYKLMKKSQFFCGQVVCHHRPFGEGKRQKEKGKSQKGEVLLPFALCPLPLSEASAAALSYQGFHTLEQYISSKRKPHAA